MHELLWQVVPVASVVLWFGGELILGVRYRAKRRAYLQKFPPVEGVPLDLYVPGGGPLRVQRAIFRALRQRQDDPQVERLRREVWRHLLAIAAWGLGGFIVLSIVLPPLLVAGDAR